MIEIWQVVALTPEGRVLRETPDARPRPQIEIEIILPDKVRAKTV